MAQPRIEEVQDDNGGARALTKAVEEAPNDPQPVTSLWDLVSGKRKLSPKDHLL